MIGIHAEAEILPNAMEAVFIHQPHWQTSSVRLAVHAGTLHEDEARPTGVAHFFEHIAFHGTAEFADEETLVEYAESNFVSQDATTYLAETVYTSDGATLDP